MVRHTKRVLYLEQDILNISKSEDGFLIMDALVAMVLAAIVALGVTQSTLIAYRYSYQNEARAAAKELAIERLEEFAAQDPEGFVDGNQIVETNVTRNSMTFTRTTDFVIEADRTRLVSVTVDSATDKFPVSVALSRGFALWGER